MLSTAPGSDIPGTELFLSGHTLVIKLQGKMTGEAVDLTLSALDKIVHEHGRVVLVVDARAVPAYETEYRVKWIAWLEANTEDCLRSVHCLFANRLVQMAVMLANAMLRTKVQPWSNIEALHAFLARNDPHFVSVR